MGETTEQVFETYDEQELERGVHQLGALYGISGLEVSIAPGQGTSCAKLAHGLLITVDPAELAFGSNAQLPTLETHNTDIRINTLFAVAHELGHAKDFLDPTSPLDFEKTTSRNFFKNLIDDTVIDARSRRIPLFKKHTDGVYGHIMPGPDLTDMPKHTQFMYGIRIGQVMSDPQVIVDPAVQQHLDAIRNVVKDGTSFNIPAVLVDPSTNLRSRRRIADAYIYDRFKELLEEDKQEHPELFQSGEGDPSPMDQTYQDYDESMHGKPHNHDRNDKRGKSSDNLSDKIKDTLEKDAQGKAPKKTPEQQKREKERKQRTPRTERERTGRLAGSLEEQMDLSPADAKEYAKSMSRVSESIVKAAEVLMLLAAPTDTRMSPRYSRAAYTEGLRLHPRTMGGVALQIASDVEQSIYQRVERRAEHIGMDFGGLDFTFLGDLSASMGGEKGRCAAEACLVLLEGLGLAQYKVTKMAGGYKQPDVRAQIIGFGSESVTLSPLSFTPKPEEKGKTYVNMRAAPGSSTLLYESLKQVRNQVEADPLRQHIAFVVSDGDIHDGDKCKKLVKGLPDNCMVVEIEIQNEPSIHISKNYERIDDPNELPGKLLSVLQSYIHGVVS